MPNWKLTLEYDGSKYRGWQEQKNANSVQGELRRAAQDLLADVCVSGARGVAAQGPAPTVSGARGAAAQGPAPTFDLQGAGRTDAGVHAEAQVAHLKFPGPATLPNAKLVDGLNARLPADIVVLAAEPMDWGFHARHDAESRTYRYQISRRKTAFAKKYVWWVKPALEVEKLHATAALLPGRHDFLAFCADDPSKPDQSTVVVVTRADWRETTNDLLIFEIEASHFLWRMVRRLVGCMARTAAGEMSVQAFERLLAGEETGVAVAEWTAPASGLFLAGVRYTSTRPAPRTNSRASARRLKRR